MLQTLRREPGFYKRLWKLSLPMILQNLITFSLGLIDTFMVSQLGNQEMAAVTTANVPVFLLISIVFGVQSGLGILASQYWGKGDTKSISRALGVASFLGTVITVVLAVVFFLFPVSVMDLLSNKHALSLLGAPYLRVIGFSYVFNMLSSAYVSVQRSVENASFGMKLFGFSTLLNTGLNYLLIFGHGGFPAMGVGGAAIATLLARVCEFLICVVCALRSKTVPLDLACFFRPGTDMARRFVKYASPVVLNEAAWGLGNSLLTVILGYTENSVAMLAANAVMGNLSRLFLVVCFGLGAATAVIVGKAIGEGKSHAQVTDLSRALLHFGVLVGGGVAIVSLLLVPLVFVPVIFPLFKLFGESAAIATALAVTGFAAIPLHAYAISSVTGVLRAGGDVAWGTALDLGPQWLLCLPLTALAALVLKTGYWPICIAIQVESIVKVPLCMWRINKGKWINDVTRGHDA
ncbi:MATE family efflux transporter [Oscillibacter sp.]|uniref:MATE family efflux transporter n=1 Tax=Oscillibacter sp. TaxID=1945593 RepID=UPI0026189833|nr:MATE family efflux transporter [Oscillibacter sp.]MDD3346995.1 MATE family efflux transporter [Oscillibacter sp.]